MLFQYLKDFIPLLKKRYDPMASAYGLHSRIPDYLTLYKKIWTFVGEPEKSDCSYISIYIDLGDILTASFFTFEQEPFLKTFPPNLLVFFNCVHPIQPNQTIEQYIRRNQISLPCIFVEE